MKALGDAANQLRAELGESRHSLEKFNTPLEKATTSFTRGSRGLYQPENVQTQGGSAIPFLKRALELDPDFARVYAFLGVACYNLNETSLALANFRKAYNLRDRVSQRERLQIEGYQYGFVTGRDGKSD